MSDRSGAKCVWREAAAISLVIAVTQVFIAFLTFYDLTRIAADLASFAFDLFRSIGVFFLRHVRRVDWAGEVLR